MTASSDALEIAWWANRIDDIDREIARLCLLCRVRILDRGVIERVLQRDESVCGTSNPVAFAKLHDLLALYFEVRRKSVAALGQVQTAQLEAGVVEQLRGSFADLLGTWPPA
jgi:hypothetical protein